VKSVDDQEQSAVLHRAYAHCEQIAKRHYENFPVASHLLPAKLRPHVAAIYAFARTADDFADEPGYHASERIALLRDWRARLRATGTGNREPGTPDPGSRFPDPDSVFLALHDTIERFSLPLQLFDDLLDAFVQDVGTPRYSTWADVLDYCRRSANPVGRLMLHLYRAADDPRHLEWSDAICSALQLTNFWQDLKIDFDRGRIYLPVEEMRGHGAMETDLAEGRLTPAWRAALSAAVARTRAMFLIGRPLCGAVAGRLKHELRATWLGGMRVLSRIERADFDVVARRPSVGAADVPWLAWKLVTWAESP